EPIAEHRIRRIDAQLHCECIAAEQYIHLTGLAVRARHHVCSGGCKIRAQVTGNHGLEVAVRATLDQVHTAGGGANEHLTRTVKISDEVGPPRKDYTFREGRLATSVDIHHLRSSHGNPAVVSLPPVHY